MQTVDLNCDLGEGAPGEAELMPLVTSANIACGGHAGDDGTMRASVALANQYRVAIGAHPGYEDREHFGRRELKLSGWEVGDLVQCQTRRLLAITQELGVSLRHVKPHGALYNQAARDSVLAEAVIDAVVALDPQIILVAPAGSLLLSTARQRGVPALSEVFADRTYQADGFLTPRTRPDALIVEESAAVAQVIRFVREGKVRSVQGTDLSLEADTVCVHGDGLHALAFVRALRRELTAAGIRVTAASR
jgi:UPF0271 protein